MIHHKKIWLTWQYGIGAMMALPVAAADTSPFLAARDNPPWPLVLGVVIVAIIVGAIRSFLEAKRRAALQQVATQLGFTFTSSVAAHLVVPANQLHLFSLGRLPRVNDLMQGRVDGVAISIFDYQYTIGSGSRKSTHTHHQSVVQFTVPGACLPAFGLRPERLWHKLGAVFGYQDIDFSSHPDFSAKYLLRGNDEPAIRKLFTAPAREFFAQQPPFCVEAAGDHLIVYREFHRVKPENILPFLATGLEVVAKFGMAQLTLGAEGRIIAG
jgi:hypothetical protein